MATFMRNFYTCHFKLGRSGIVKYHKRYLSFLKSHTQVSENSPSIYIRHSCSAKPNTGKESAVRRLHHISSVENRLCNSRKLSNWSKNILKTGKRASSVNWQCVRSYSSQGPGGDDGESPPVQGSQYLPTPLTVPDYFPRVPVLAVNRNPVFPKFSKMLEVC